MQLNFYTCGEGFPLIILHGLFGSSDNWQTMSKRFSEHFRVFALDQRNHGASPHNDVFDYQAMAEDVREFMDAHQLPEAIVLGHSMGGKSAMQFAATYPDRLRKLIVADIAPKDYPPHHTAILEAMATFYVAKCNSRTEIDKGLEPAIPETAVRQFLLKNVNRDSAGHFQWKIAVDIIRKNYGNILKSPEIKIPVQTPTLFLRGEKSHYIVPGDETGIQHHFPNSKIVTIPGADHWLHSEKPDQFFAAVMEFLG